MTANSSSYEEYHNWKGWESQSGFGILTNAGKRYFEIELRRSKRYLPAIKNVLEMGFGNGEFLAFAKSKGWNILGTELNPTLVEFGKKAEYDVRLAKEVPKIPEKTFDLIVAFDVFEHIPQGAIIETLIELKSKLCEGGVFLIRFPNADHWLGNVHQHGDPTHVTQIGRLKLEYFCERAGLKIVNYRPMASRGFTSGFLIGLHSILSFPLLRAYHWFQKLLFFPGLNVILSSTDCVALLVDANQRSIGE